MNTDNKMPLMEESNPSVSLEKLPQIVGSDMNFDKGLTSSSLGQASSTNDAIPPIMIDVSPDASADEFTEPVVGDQGNNEASNEDAHLENEQPSNSNRRKREHYHRLTKYQIQEMEAFLKRYPHPDEQQRRKLGRELGLDPLKVKFWFQNRRTQMKNQQERGENIQLRIENEKLRSENIMLKGSISISTCNKCSGASVAQKLRLENERLKEEIAFATTMVEQASSNLHKSLSSSYTPSSSLNQGELKENIPSGDIVCKSKTFRPLQSLSELDTSTLLELMNSAVEEVAVMARIGEPIWIPDFERNKLVLNEEEYLKTFPMGFAPKQVGYKSEASRESTIVRMSPLNILEIFMEQNKWLAVFSGVISKALLLEALPTDVAESYNGTLQVISAIFHVLSPVVPSRDCVFVRYCKKLEEEMWAVVDVSVDALLRKDSTSSCQRRPSGCIIQPKQNGCSMITWVEHVQVNDPIIHSLSWPIINSGDAYGAGRWISVFTRQCERLASAMGKTHCSYYEDLKDIVITHTADRQNVFKLAERMVLSFCSGVASFGACRWATISGDGVDGVRIMAMKSIGDPGRPSGLVISASFCFWIPVLPKTVFDYFRNEQTRAKWDILSVGGGVQRMGCIGNSQEIGNCITILQVLNPHKNQGNMMILQESSTEPTSSYIVYAPVDIVSANMLFKGENPENVQLLPSGFTILPSGPPGVEGNKNVTNAKGSLLSVAFQMLVDSDPNAKLSVASIAMVNNLIESTAEKIKIALGVN